jgi:hypothetical protein
MKRQQAIKTTAVIVTLIIILAIVHFGGSAIIQMITRMHGG